MKNLIENIELIVPVEKHTRLNIRKKVDEYFTRNPVVPPVSYDILREYANQILKLNQWSSDWLAFIMVCCGNAIWRNVVGSIPFERRILLLPQCLKSSKLCKAGIDEFGLLCENCGNCTIPDFTEYAEKLGYVVLITEGTSVAAKLIESGKIDAVIGVGCMEVLQKIYGTVQKHFVPGIGIPLLGNGCKDTIADVQWIQEELQNNNQNPEFKILNAGKLKSQVQSIFTRESLKTLLSASDNETIAIAVKSILLGGSRYRAFLTALAYEAFSRRADEQILSKLSLSIECFHKASLIHDDIEDNDDTRYGKETIHSEYGVPVAINTGDLLIGEGYRLIADAGLPPEATLQCFKLISEGHKTIAIGQGTELLSVSNSRILSVDKILEVFDQKTATAFKVSLLLGAVAGGASPESLKLLESFSVNIGIAYQIKDDINDFTTCDGDIEKRKFSIIVSLLFDKIKDSEREKLLLSLRNNCFDPIYQLISRYQIKDKAIGLLKCYISKAKNNLDDLHNPGIKIALNSLVEKMFKDYLS